MLFSDNSQVSLQNASVPDFRASTGVNSKAEVQSLNLYNLISEGAIEFEKGRLVATPEFVNDTAIDTLLGQFTIISSSAEHDNFSKPAHEIVSRFQKSDLVKFQLDLAQGMSRWISNQQQELSVHARQLLNYDFSPSNVEAIPGFSGHSAKAIPLHRDLAQYERNGTIELYPATFSLIAWGGRHGFNSRTSLNFAEAPEYTDHKAHGESRHLISRPELSISGPKSSSAIQPIQFELPDWCITIFGNRNRYHGATWDQFKESRLLNKQIDAEAQESTKEVRFARPIHVVLL